MGACFYNRCIFGGLRRAESFGLKIDGIIADDDKAVIEVRHEVQVVDGIVESTPLKTAGSERDVVIPPPYAQQLLQLRDEAVCKALLGG